MKVICYTRLDGGLSVIIPAPEARLAGESEDGFVARVRARDTPRDALEIKVAERDEIPQDRTFRNAWRLLVGAISYDIDQCREIWKDRMRRTREPLLAALDVAYMKALEIDDKAALTVIAAKKQELRDVTDDTDLIAATTPDEIKAVWPDILGARP